MDTRWCEFVARTKTELSKIIKIKSDSPGSFNSIHHKMQAILRKEGN